MNTKEQQPLIVQVEFKYDAPVFEEDPDDIFEIARLEQDDLNNNPHLLADLIRESSSVTVRVDPRLGEE